MTLKPKTQKAVRTGLWLLVDAVLINLAMILSQVLRYTTTISYSFFQIYFRIAPAMTLMGLILFAVFGLYRTMWQYASAEDLLRVVLSTLALAVCTYLYSVIANYFVRPQNLFRLHRLIYPLFWLISMALVGASRLIYRYAVTRRHFPFFPRRTVGQRRTMIVGAGWLGANVVHEMQHGNYGSCVPVIVVDDDQQRTGSSLSGVPVVRGSGNILKLASDYSIDDIIIAISTPKADLNPVIEKCLATGCRVKRVTPLQNLEGSRPSAGALRELNIGDLLGRPEEQLDMTQVAAFVRDKTILITGGGGSIGSELCRQLFPLQPRRIVLYDISENYMYDLYSDLEREYRQDLSQKLILCVGSIRDEQRLDEVFGCYKPEIVLHAAAHKHVPLMEDCPDQAVKNNVFGTNLTALAAIRHGVRRFVLISTDKAVNPTNVMGATKRLAEMVIEARNAQSATEFTAVRFGNVLGSHGSVVPKFEQQIRSGGPITLTHPEIIRYFMTIPEAAELVLQVGAMAHQNELYVLDMGRPVKILDLAENMIRLSGYVPYRDIDIIETGLRPGEKLYEELLIAGRDLEKTGNGMIFVEHQPPVTPEELERKLTLLNDALEKTMRTEDISCIREVLHRVVPTFHEPEEVNARQGDTVEIPAQETVPT